MKVAIKVAVDLSALENLTRRLKELDAKAARKAIKDGINDITKLVLADARALVPQRTGALRKSLGRAVKAYRGGAVVVGVVKPRSGVWVKDGPGIVGTHRRNGKVFVPKFRTQFGGRMVNPVKYAHLVEFGRASFGTKNKKVLADAAGGVVFGTRVKAMAPRPFMRPAWDNVRFAATGIIRDRLTAAIQRFWSR